MMSHTGEKREHLSSGREFFFFQRPVSLTVRSDFVGSLLRQRIHARSAVGASRCRAISAAISKLAKRLKSVWRTRLTNPPWAIAPRVRETLRAVHPRLYHPLGPAPLALIPPRRSHKSNRVIVGSLRLSASFRTRVASPPPRLSHISHPAKQASHYHSHPRRPTALQAMRNGRSEIHTPNPL